MDIRFETSQKEVAAMETDGLRKQFLCEELIRPGSVNMVYSHYDRMIVGGLRASVQPLSLEPDPELRATYFLERRELGIINVGGKGFVEAGQEKFLLDKMSCCYLGKGTRTVRFFSESAADPAIFYFLSAPAHAEYPARLMKKDEASPVNLGSPQTSNERTIYKYIHAEGIQSCQLVMGLTMLASGSVWNSIPPHTHTRRMEVYFYFDLPGDQRVFHFMGEPQQTRHLVMSNHQAVISPPWSIHCGCGTTNYGFIWGMAGENQTFTDMDAAPVAALK